jgi:hypothetical protein
MLGSYNVYLGEAAFPFSIDVEGRQEVVIRIVTNAQGGLPSVMAALLSPQIR